MRKHLYRFISFEDFINLVINNKDRFVRPSIWDDGYEGYLFSSLDSPEDVRHIVYISREQIIVHGYLDH